MIRRPPRSTRVRSSAASDVYKRQFSRHWREIRLNFCRLTTKESPKVPPFAWRGRVPWRNPERNGVGTAAEQRLRNRRGLATFLLSTPQRQARREVPRGGFNDDESKTVIDRSGRFAAQRRRRIGATNG